MIIRVAVLESANPRQEECEFNSYLCDRCESRITTTLDADKWVTKAALGKKPKHFCAHCADADHPRTSVEFREYDRDDLFASIHKARVYMAQQGISPNRLIWRVGHEVVFNLRVFNADLLGGAEALTSLMGIDAIEDEHMPANRLVLELRP